MEYPKYYRCTNNIRAEMDFTIGKIYECINPTNLEALNNFIGNTGYTNGWSYSNFKHFTPVTEEEWNLQEGITSVKQDYTYLIDILEKHNIK